MKTVFNWTVGSFFRSIGRIVAYVFIGGIIAYLLNRSGFDWGRLLGIEKVNASSFEYKWIQSAQWKISGGTYANAPADGSQYYNFTSSLSNNSKIYFIKFRNSFTINNDIKNMLFNVKVDMTQPTTFDFSTNSFTCTITSQMETPDMAITNYPSSSPTGEYEDFERWYKSFTCNTQYSNGEVQETKYAITLYYWAEGREGEHFPCFAQASAGQNFTFSCPRYNNNIGGLVIKIWSNTVTDFTLGVNDVFTIEKDSVTSAINEQTQQQQQQYNDTNSTSESNTATSYFNSQQDDTPSALTSAITSPLRIIDNAIQGTHNPLCFTLNSKQSCIPSGDIIWQNYDTSNSRHHWFDSSFVGGGGSAVSKFQQFFNIVVAGYLCYKMLLSMMRIFNDSVDPTVSRIEVMKL